MKLELDGRRRRGIWGNIGRNKSSGKAGWRGRTWEGYRTSEDGGLRNRCLRDRRGLRSWRGRGLRRLAEHFHAGDQPFAVAFIEEGGDAAGFAGDGLGGFCGGSGEANNGLGLGGGQAFGGG